MNGFASFVTAFCAGCVLIGGLYIICPEGTMSKPIKYIFSLVFILIVITAASITVKKADISINVEQFSGNDTENMNLTSAEYVYAYALNSAGINFSKITVCTDKNDDDSIVISKVIIYSDADKQRITEALNIVAQNYEVEIINE